MTKKIAGKNAAQASPVIEPLLYDGDRRRGHVRGSPADWKIGRCRSGGGRDCRDHSNRPIRTGGVAPPIAVAAGSPFRGCSPAPLMFESPSARCTMPSVHGCSTALRMDSPAHEPFRRTTRSLHRHWRMRHERAGPHAHGQRRDRQRLRAASPTPPDIGPHAARREDFPRSERRTALAARSISWFGPPPSATPTRNSRPPAPMALQT